MKEKIKKPLLTALFAFTVVALTAVFVIVMCYLRHEYLQWNRVWLCFVYSAIVSAIFTAAFTYLYLKLEKKPDLKKRLLFGGISFIAYLGLFWLLALLFNLDTNHNVRAVNVAQLVAYLLFAAASFAALTVKVKKKLRVLNVALTVLIIAVTGFYGFIPFHSNALTEKLILNREQNQSISAVGYTSGTPIIGTRREYVFDNDGLLLGGYCTYSKDLNGPVLAKEAGLDFLIGGATEKYLDACEKNGIGIIVSSSNLPQLYLKSTDEDINAWYNFDGSDYKDHPAIWGDNFYDEPFSEYYYLLPKGIEQYESVNKGKMPYVNLLPPCGMAGAKEVKSDEFANRMFWQYVQNDDYKAYVSDFINTVDTDYLSLDKYPMEIRDGKKYTDQNYLFCIDVLADAAKATSRDLWVIVQSAGMKNDKMRYCDQISDVYQQDYVALAFGAKAIIYACFQTGWWDDASHMVTKEGKTTDTYDAVQSVNAELLKFRDVYSLYDYRSTYWLNEEKVAGRSETKNYGKLAGTIESEKADIQTENGLLIGTFADKDGKKAYVITNMEELGNEVTATATFNAEGTITVYQKGVPTVIDGGSAAITLTPGEGVFITVD